MTGLLIRRFGIHEDGSRVRCSLFLSIKQETFCFADALAVKYSINDRMQAEVTDSSLREGIEALDVKDTEKSAATGKDDENTEQRDAEMADATEEDSATKDGTSNKGHINRKTIIGFQYLKLFNFRPYILVEKIHQQLEFGA